MRCLRPNSVSASLPCGPGVRCSGQKRVALVIGNAAYANTTPLTNPGNDAADVAAALRRLNFQVIDGRNLDKRSMERTIRQFAIELAGADVAIFYYAGHGLQMGGQIYLVPTDAKLSGEGDLDFESVPLALVVKQMEREAKTVSSFWMPAATIRWDAIWHGRWAHEVPKSARASRR